MKTEPKAFASLSSGLLARKGAARPAMRPQGFGQIGSSLEDLGWNDLGFEPPKPSAAPRDSDHDGFGEDVAQHPNANGHHGHGPGGHAGLTPLGSPVHDQQARIVDRLASDEEDEEVGDVVEAKAPADPAPVARPAPATPPVAAIARRPTKPRAEPGSKGKAAFTLRLDPERHLRLRLACALTGRSAQRVVTDALDSWLEGMPELEGMAEKAKRKG